ncbi:hypothetical protein D5086_026163 [Populus alba]|uniref:Uncharacterized protein n=1 Tax=Populus alba TaxID=43335 RepID=A0ACC4B1Y4_POPAL
MENEPFLGNQTSYKPKPVVTLTQSLSTPILFPEIQDAPKTPSTSPSPSPPLGPPNTHFKKPGTLHRCKTAPAMVVMRGFQPTKPQIPKPQSDSTSIIRQATFLLSMYLLLGVVIYSFNTDHFSGIETHPVVDALYFCIVTMCTIGYGDITPLTPVTKGRMRIRLKVGLALGVVVLCIGIGTLVLYFLEDLDWIDSVYLAVMSVTTVGYGDRAFKTLPGRLFAAIWLLVSTLAVARAFLYLAEARIDKRHRRITNWVLHRDITVEDLLAADMNNNGFISSFETSAKYDVLQDNNLCLVDCMISGDSMDYVANRFPTEIENNIGEQVV